MTRDEMLTKRDRLFDELATLQEPTHSLALDEEFENDDNVLAKIEEIAKLDDELQRTLTLVN